VPILPGEEAMKGDGVGRRCEVCYQENGRHWTTPHIHRRKPDNCTCGHERDAHGWVLPCLCRACSCAGFVGRDDFSCDRWLKGQR
jgi:hypothetical protein